MKKFEIKIKSEKDEYGNICGEEVWSDNEDESVHFSVYNLCECPEDAIIGRDLFNGADFIEAVKLGFRIAKRGYDKIVVTDMDDEE